MTSPSRTFEVSKSFIDQCKSHNATVVFLLDVEDALDDQFIVYKKDEVVVGKIFTHTRHPTYSIFRSDRTGFSVWVRLPIQTDSGNWVRENSPYTWKELSPLELLATCSIDVTEQEDNCES